MVKALGMVNPYKMNIGGNAKSTKSNTEPNTYGKGRRVGLSPRMNLSVGAYLLR